jgi:DNA-binding response OmpR family regulator
MRLNRVLLVEDNEPLTRMLSRLLQPHCKSLEKACSVAEVKELRKKGSDWDVVLSDYNLPDGNGEDLCLWLRREEKWSGGFLLISGHFRPETPCSEYEFLAKPFAFGEVLQALEKLGSAV